VNVYPCYMDILESGVAMVESAESQATNKVEIGTLVVNVL